MYNEYIASYARHQSAQCFPPGVRLSNALQCLLKSKWKERQGNSSGHQGWDGWDRLQAGAGGSH